MIFFFLVIMERKDNYLEHLIKLHIRIITLLFLSVKDILPGLILCVKEHLSCIIILTVPLCRKEMGVSPVWTQNLHLSLTSWKQSIHLRQSLAHIFVPDPFFLDGVHVLSQAQLSEGSTRQAAATLHQAGHRGCLH